jgi:fumarate reductase subunit D
MRRNDRIKFCLYLMAAALAIAVIVLVIGFLFYMSYFALAWGFNPLMAFPTYFIGLIICGVMIAIGASMTRRARHMRHGRRMV